MVVRLKGKPRDTLADFAFRNGALVAAPAVVDDIQKGRLARLRGPGDDIETVELELNVGRSPPRE